MTTRYISKDLAHSLVLNPPEQVQASGLWDTEEGGLWIFRRTEADLPYKAEGAFVPVGLTMGSSPDSGEVGISGLWTGTGIIEARIGPAGPLVIVDIPGIPYRYFTDDEVEAVQADASKALHEVLIGVGTSHSGRTHSHLIHHLTAETAQWASGPHRAETEIAVGIVPSRVAHGL